MEQEELLNKFKEKFNEFKQQYKFSITFEQIEQELYMTDVIWDRGYVPRDIASAIRGRMMDMFNSWYGFMHGLLLPNPQSIPMHMEAQFFDDTIKTQVQTLMHQTMSFMKGSSVVGLSRDKEQDARFIEEAFSFWQETLKPKMVELTKKSQEGFLQESKRPPQNSKNNMY